MPVMRGAKSRWILRSTAPERAPEDSIRRDRALFFRLRILESDRPMDALREVDLGGEKSFIGAWYLSNLTVCDELIAYFKQCKGDHGQIGQQSKVEPGQIG